MTNIDQFESVFKSADKERFAPEVVEIRRVLAVTDADPPAADHFSRQARSFLNVLELPESDGWTAVCGSQFHSMSELMAIVAREKPDMIVTHRNLHSSSRAYPYSLGGYIDVLTQATSLPIALLPRPDLNVPLQAGSMATDRVMAITDHLTGDHHLVSFAARMTLTGGTLFLTHVEDEAMLQRFMAAIAKIPEIDTAMACDLLREQLLKEPTEYVATCREGLAKLFPSIKTEAIVTSGNRLADYQRLVDEREIDMLVFNTKDDDQLAMHGLAYPLAVEMVRTPLLLL